LEHDVLEDETLEPQRGVVKLSFPNASRSYDAAHKWVRFWAYDESLEVPFFVDAAALQPEAASLVLDERSILKNFDEQWDAICAAAERVYSRRSRGSYFLKAADLARAS
jgi:hypothetical protein